MPDDRRGVLVRASLAGLGATILVLACCAAAPLLLGAVGGLTLLTFTGVGAALVLAAVLALGLVHLRHRRRTCQSDWVR
jgi:membrane protein YdbS with pleckstrin-like domain